MTNFVDALAPWPEDDFSVFGPVEVKPRSKMQQIVGRFLGRNWVRIPHVTHHEEIDVTEIEARRTEWNNNNPRAKITPITPVIKALALALSEHPLFASSLDASGDNLIMKKYTDIGVAVEVPAGLLVPVLRDCGSKPLSQISAELTTIAVKARTKGLSMQEMSGGCISVSSLGHIGGTGFTPIVNAPEVEILGVTKLQIRPRPGQNTGEIDWRRMLPLSLSYDHRVINGAEAARFVRTIGVKLDTIHFVE
jgi:pyruvate dehydrogenase E2 component (dihydrolipoamide acetyltransferase)